MAKYPKPTQYVDPNTLIVGIDIGKTMHYVKIMHDDRVLTQFKLPNRRGAFMRLCQTIADLQEQHQSKDALIGMEPTGHYWLPLAYFLHACKQPLVLVQPSHVRWSKEMGDNSPLKTDEKDAGVIAELVRQGKYHTAYVPQGVYADLRYLTAMRYHKKDQITAAKNVLTRILDVLFPEFATLFSDLSGKTARQLLSEAPTSSHLQALGIKKLTALILKASNHRLGKAKALAILEAAKTSIGVRKALDSAWTMCLS